MGLFQKGGWSEEEEKVTQIPDGGSWGPRLGGGTRLRGHVHGHNRPRAGALRATGRADLVPGPGPGAAHLRRQQVALASARMMMMVVIQKTANLLIIKGIDREALRNI